MGNLKIVIKAKEEKKSRNEDEEKNNLDSRVG